MLDFLIGITRYYFIISTFYFIILIIRKDKKIKDLINQGNIIISINIICFIIFFKSNIVDIPLEAMGMVFIVQFLGWIIFLVAIILLCKKSELSIWYMVLYLINISIIEILRLDTALIGRHLIFIGSGIGISIILYLIINEQILIFLKKRIYIYQFLCFIVLLLPFFSGEEQYGSLNWFNFYGITFQPSEIGKLLFILYLATLYTKKLSLKNYLHGSITSLIFVMVLVYQRDLGTALIYFVTYLIMTYIYTSNEMSVLVSLGLLSLASYISYNYFYHVQSRVESWINPWKYIDTKGYQIAQSLFAIAAGGWLGTGFTKGKPDYIPIVSKDFVFSAIAEEFGNIIAIFIIIFYIIFIYKGFKVLLNNMNYDFISYIMIGILTVIGFQSFLIIGGVVKFIPLTGVTLPFVSYGGSSMIVNFILLGILQGLIKVVKKDGTEET